MRFVFASDSFKGSLSSAMIGELLETAAHEAFPDAECIAFPIADGGEGTLDAIERVRSGKRAVFLAHDGLMRPVDASVLLSDDSAFVEAASTCGLTLLAVGERNPLATSSYGVGECIRFALDRGCKSISIGLGGSCTNDGGMGCLRALGVRFYDDNGRELEGCGADLERVARIDARDLHHGVHDATFTIMSDVTNPLLGPNGATFVFGKQKGANDLVLKRLEAGMRHFAGVISETYPDIDFQTAGYGAAGGLGMALSVFLSAHITSGIEELLRWFDFDAALEGANLVVTGEGKLDSQSLDGKAVSGIIAHAQSKRVLVAIICGKLDLDAESMQDMGLAHVLESGKGQALDYAMTHAKENYLESARNLFRTVRDEATC